MYNILVVDDEIQIRKLIKKYAEYEGHDVTEAENGIEAVRLCENRRFDIIIMDIMMTVLDGLSASRIIRGFSDTPILILSARGEEYDKISGFRVGIDDYVVKPFSGKELMMRIDAIMKRVNSPKKEEKKDLFRYRGLEIDFAARTVVIDGERAYLSPKEYDLLSYMCKNKNIALSRERLITEVWGYDFFGDDRTLDTHIKLLRKTLKNYSDMIVTLRGVGYRFDTE
ncbi:MAG: response regulator transcription factor [Clostridia bacterium]|nr:response regulator transcription factor [Clostridia bacterium]